MFILNIIQKILEEISCQKGSMVKDTETTLKASLKGIMDANSSKENI